MEASGSKGSEQMVEQSISEKSKEILESNMDENVKEEMDRKLNKVDLHGMLKVNLIKCIERMRISPKEAFHFTFSSAEWSTHYL
jgi:hypothetical protein